MILFPVVTPGVLALGTTLSSHTSESTLTARSMIAIITSQRAWVLQSAHVLHQPQCTKKLQSRLCDETLTTCGGVGGTVASESALRSQGPFCRGFEPRHRRPGLTEGLKA
ncbi:hypothetical protein PoB_007525000 [Plakobranchus ocellatus]|uniref:Secreted protein n=1 Tax=Plakobranchus ocellatus TaxID=259542 RepID=A0AAV4DX47_9GAST|nr:hypothetical protein PoB_007525000 [Plakobranchus ocellatus]